MLECAVVAPSATSELDFYRAIRRFDITNPDTKAALGFARTFAELVQRILAARAAQQGTAVAPPPAMGLPALLAYAQAGYPS